MLLFERPTTLDVINNPVTQKQAEHEGWAHLIWSAPGRQISTVPFFAISLNPQPQLIAPSRPAWQRSLTHTPSPTSHPSRCLRGVPLRDAARRAPPTCRAARPSCEHDGSLLSELLQQPINGGLTGVGGAGCGRQRGPKAAARASG